VHSCGFGARRGVPKELLGAVLGARPEAEWHGKKNNNRRPNVPASVCKPYNFMHRTRTCGCLQIHKALRYSSMNSEGGWWHGKCNIFAITAVTPSAIPENQMNPTHLNVSSPRRARILGLSCALLVGSALSAAASVITIDFDSVAAGGGIDPTAYLASYGVTLSGVSPSDPLIYSDQAFYGTGVVDASSGNNFLLQQSAVNGGSFTLNFATALTNLEFTRIQNLTYNLVGTWSATAYAGSTVVGSVSEPFGLGPFTPATYSFSGAGITSLTVSGNGFGSAGISSAMIDDIKMTSVPDASSTLALLGLSFSAFALMRRRFAR
jgi:hypothetical protein